MTQTNQADRDRGPWGLQSLVRNHPGEAASVMGHKVLCIATHKPRTWDDPEFPTNLKRRASLHSSSSSPLLLLLLFLQHFYSVGADRITLPSVQPPQSNLQELLQSCSYNQGDLARDISTFTYGEGKKRDISVVKSVQNVQTLNDKWSLWLQKTKDGYEQGLTCPEPL